MTSMITRRTFATGTLTVLSSHVFGANDRIHVGLIGVGSRGTFHLNDLAKLQEKHNVTISAVCDVFRPAREKAASAVKQFFGRNPLATADYRELLASRDVDAVVIATPDFQHAIMLKDAIEAGKDVYCEKPMATDLAEGRAAYLAGKRSDRVIQIGTQRRSDGRHIAAARLIQQGTLGKITRIEMGMHFHEQRWARDYSDVRPEDVEWDLFLLHRKKLPFDPKRFRQWQLFREFTNGIAGLWMSHFIDLVHWMMEDPYPKTAVASGGVYLWKDGRDTRDVFHALFEYPKEFHVSFIMTLTNAANRVNLWCGTRGVIDMERWIISGEGSNAKDRIQGEQKIDPVPTNSHMENWLECIRTRQTPRADIQAGFSHAVAGCMAVECLEKGRRVGFDPQRLEFTYG